MSHSFGLSLVPKRVFRPGVRFGAAASKALFQMVWLIAATSLSAFAGTATTTTLAVNSSGSAVTTVASGAVVTLTATVIAGTTPVTTGLVNFCDATAEYCTDIHLLGAAQLTTAGSAVYKFRPGVGSHSYKAVFAGTTNNSSSISRTMPLVVTGLSATWTTIAQSGTASNYSLTAVVGGAGSAAPQGTVSFLNMSNGDSQIASAPLVSNALGPSFFNSSNPGTDLSPYSVVVGDFNGDGIPDLATADIGVNNLTVLLGNGDGTFRPAPANPQTGSGPQSLAVGDFNGDGIPDLAVGNYRDNTMTILIGNGDGTFETPSTGPISFANAQSIAVGDFNGDGIQDLAVMAGAQAGSFTVDGGVVILLGNGDGTFSIAPPGGYGTGANPRAIAVGDFNGDGIQDLAVTNNGTSPSDGSVTILLGKGDATFSVAVSPTAGAYPWGIVAGDFNGDGKSDLAVANEYGSGTNGAVTVLLSNGDGTFTAAANPVAGLSGAGIALGDFNGDGIPDLAVASLLSNAITVMLGDGKGGFASVLASPTTGDFPLSAAVGDFNGDGLNDVAAANFNSNTVTVLLTGSQTATATATGVEVPVAAGTEQVVASYTGESPYAASTSSATVLNPAQLAPTVNLALSPNPVSVDRTVNFTATVTGSGPTPTGLVSFYYGGNSLGPSQTVNSLGVAPSGTNLLPAGVYSITARYSGDSNYVAGTSSSQTLTVLNGPSVTVTPSASSITFTQQLSVAVSVAGGSGLPTPTGSVTLTSGSYTSAVTNLSNGGSTINVPGGSLAAGNDTLTVSYTPDSSSSVNYNGALGTALVTVLQGTPTISWRTPAAITDGTALSATQLDATASVPGAFVYTPAAGTIPPVGTDTLTVVFTPTDNDDYTTATDSVNLTVNVLPNPVPFLGNITPAVANAGGAAFTITVNGSGFVTASAVYWSTSALTTQFVSSTQLTATVTAADIATPGATAITVQTPGPGGGTSDVLQFEIDSPSGSSTAPSVPSTVVTVTAGKNATYSISFPPSVINATASCLNLPAGAICSFSFATGVLTISTSSTTPAGTYQITVVFAETVASTSSALILLPFLLLPLFFLRRKQRSRGIWHAVWLCLILMAGTAFSVGCGGSSSPVKTTTTQSVTSSGVVGMTVQ